MSRTETHDGDGVGVKSVTTSQQNGGTPVTTATFYLRSTVLGGRTISEYDSAGTRQKAYVYAGGELLAQQERIIDPITGGSTTRLFWQHNNPLNGDGLITDFQGTNLGRITVDPTGVDLGDSDPFSTGEGNGGAEDAGQMGIDAKVAQLIPGFGGPQVKLDGFLTSPYLGFSALASGAAVRVNPGTNTTSRIVRFGGHTVLAVFRAFHDGYQGFIPNNAVYTSNGSFSLAGPPNGAGLRNGGLELETDFSQLNRTGNNEQFLARSSEFIGPQNPTQTPTPDPCASQLLVIFNLRDAGGEPNINLIHRSEAENFLNALLEINAVVPGGIGFKDVFRDSAMQARRRAAFEARRGPGARRPGTSSHEAGLAVDVALTDVQKNPIVVDIFAKYGWIRPFKDEDWHFEPKTFSASMIREAQEYYRNCVPH